MITIVETIERYKFYEEAKAAYAIVATSEPSLYANFNKELISRLLHMDGSNFIKVMIYEKRG